MMSDLSGFQKRIARIRSSLIQRRDFGLLFLNIHHIRYLVGFTGSEGALVVGSEKVFLLVDARYTTQAGNETDVDVIEFRDKIDGIRQIIDQTAIRELGFDASAASYDFYLNLKSKLGEIELKPLVSEIEAIRSIKDQHEISQIRKAAEIASAAMLSLLTSIKPGMEERGFALELEYLMRTGGAEAVAFETICASGPNSALPHARPGKRAFDIGNFVTIDFGAVFNGYHSDETCTIALGEIDKEQKEVYAIVKTAHDLGLEKIRAGVPCSEIDGTVRDYIEGQGYGAFFGHGTGHGVGLEVHEPPRLARNADMVLQAGMVVTVEPGIYLPGRWGVRIEDLVLVKEDSFEVLSKFPKDLQILPIS